MGFPFVIFSFIFLVYWTSAFCFNQHKLNMLVFKSMNVNYEVCSFSC
jgi:hypothetical protein